MVDKIKPQLNIILVRWNKLAIEDLKLNIDGCSKGNPGNAGGGGILRYHLGHMIMEFTIYLGCCSNSYAEAQAIKTGLRWCLDHGFNMVTIESDSFLMIQIIKGNITTSWHIKDEISEIQAMNLVGHFQFDHTFREGNIPAELLSNLVVLDRKNIFFTEAIGLPRQIISPMKNDEIGRPNFRIRLRKSTFIFDPG